MNRSARPIIVGGHIAVVALSSVQPVLQLATRYCEVANAAAQGDVMVSCLVGPSLAFDRALPAGQASGTDDFSSLPALGDISRTGFGAAEPSILIFFQSSPAPVLLRIAVAREDFDQEFMRIRIRVLPKLFVPTGEGRRVEAPGIAMGNHEIGIVPFVQLFE